MLCVRYSPMMSVFWSFRKPTLVTSTLGPDEATPRSRASSKPPSMMRAPHGCANRRSYPRTIVGCKNPPGAMSAMAINAPR